MRAGPQAVVAFRVAAQGLAARDGAPPAAGLAGWAVQDSPPGAAAAALAARAEELAPGWLDRALEDRALVALYNPRTATAVLPAREAAAFATALLPRDDAGLRAVAGQAVPDRREGLAEPVGLAVAAVSDALDGVVLSRDELHEALRARLPAALLPWCAGCRSHHARRGLLVLAGLHGRLCHAGRAGRQPAFARTDQWVGWEPPEREVAGAELVRRHLRWAGPTTRQALAAWAGIGTAQARELWTLVEDELAEVALEDGGRAWVLAEDAALLADPPSASGARLLGPGDPLLQPRDREVLVADPAVRRTLWAPIPGPGLLLVDGLPVALWRARRAGRALAVRVAPFARVGARGRAAAEDEAQRLAPHRGAERATVAWED